MRIVSIIAFAGLAVGGTASFLATPARAAQSAPAEARRGQPEGRPESVVTASAAVVQVARWIIASGDNGDLPFIIIDKSGAALFVFGAERNLVAAAPALVGVASGDLSSPGIGDRDLAKIGPAERTTPAGRFVARYGLAAGGISVLWVDYATSVALHPIPTENPKERRAQRLRSPRPDDNRITYGCINVAARFYSKVVRPIFRRSGGIVYILPDTQALDEVFPGLRINEYTL